MTATDLFTAMVANSATTREEVDNFFYLLSQDTLANQEAMTLTTDDGIIYTTSDSKTIRVTN